MEKPEQLVIGVEFDAQQLLHKAEEDTIEWVEREVKEQTEGKGESGEKVTSATGTNRSWISPPPSWVKC